MSTAENCASAPPKRLRWQGNRRSRIENCNRLARSKLARGRAVVAETDNPPRPRTWGECQRRGLGAVRPCHYVSCAYHLALDVSPSDAIVFAYAEHVRFDTDDGVPEIDLAALPATCALAVAARGGATLEDVGEVLGVTRERARQMEMAIVERARRRLVVLGADNDVDRAPWDWDGRTGDDLALREGGL